MKICLFLVIGAQRGITETRSFFFVKTGAQRAITYTIKCLSNSTLEPIKSNYADLSKQRLMTCFIVIITNQTQFEHRQSRVLCPRENELKDIICYLLHINYIWLPKCPFVVIGITHGSLRRLKKFVSRKFLSKITMSKEHLSRLNPMIINNCNTS